MIAIGSDHAGFKLKKDLIAALRERNRDVADLGCPDPRPFDYPDVARVVAAGVAAGTYERGVLICSSGIGMSIAANRFRGVRAALCLDELMAQLSRQHNDSNVLVLGARFTPLDKALMILDMWLSTGFEGGRHLRRVKKIEGGDV